MSRCSVMSRLKSFSNSRYRAVLFSGLSRSSMAPWRYSTRILRSSRRISSRTRSCAAMISRSLIVLSADGGRPLEHHVLEEVRNAGDAEAFVGASDVRHPAARDGRFIVPFDQQKPHPIAELLLDDGDFLRRQRQRPGKIGR